MLTASKSAGDYQQSEYSTGETCSSITSMISIAETEVDGHRDKPRFAPAVCALDNLMDNPDVVPASILPVHFVCLVLCFKLLSIHDQRAGENAFIPINHRLHYPMASDLKMCSQCKIPVSCSVAFTCVFNTRRKRTIETLLRQPCSASRCTVVHIANWPSLKS